MVWINELGRSTAFPANDGPIFQGPTNRAVQFPKTGPSRRKVIASDGNRIKERCTSSGKSVEIRRTSAFKSLFEEEIIICGKNLDGMSPQSPTYPGHKLRVGIAFDW